MNPIGKYAYSMSEPHLSGYRLILGYNTLDEVQAAQISACELASMHRTNVNPAPQYTSQHGEDCICVRCSERYK